MSDRKSRENTKTSQPKSTKSSGARSGTGSVVTNGSSTRNGSSATSGSGTGSTATERSGNGSGRSTRARIRARLGSDNTQDSITQNGSSKQSENGSTKKSGKSSVKPSQNGSTKASSRNVSTRGSKTGSEARTVTSDTNESRASTRTRIRARMGEAQTSTATSESNDEKTSASKTDDEDESDTEEDEEESETDDEESLESDSSLSSTDEEHCTLCKEELKEDKFKKCVYGHRICFNCFGFGDSELEPWSDEEQAMSSNTCVACQKNVLDKEKNINGYPPRFLKFYLIRKLLEEDPPLCDVATSHEPGGDIRSVFFCIDCDIHACRDCLLDHLDGGDKSSHNLLNLLRAAYKSEKLFCFECHQNEAIYYCPGQNCDFPLCANCVREKHRFHKTFALTEAQRNMLIYINKQRVTIREYRESVDIELQRRKELREAKQAELDNLLGMIKDTAEKHRKMIDEDEKKLTDVVLKHQEDIFAVYDVIDNAVNRKDIILKYFEYIHTRLREKEMDDERRVDAYSFCRENDKLLKTHKELHERLSLKFEAELSTMKFTERDNVEKFRLAGNNILGDLKVKERKLDPDRLQECQYVSTINTRGRNDRIQPEITCIRFLEGTDKIAMVDSFNYCVKIISKYNMPLHDKEEDVRIDIIPTRSQKIMSEGDRVLLDWNVRDQLLIVCNSSDYKVYVFELDGKRVWSYTLPPGAGAAISLYHSLDGALYVGRNHQSMENYGGILEIHMMLQKGRYQLLRQQDRYYLDHKPLHITVSPSGHTIIYDGNTLAFLSKSLHHIRTEDKRYKEWQGLEASDMFMTKAGNLVLVDPTNLYPDNAITVLNEEGYVIGFPLASAGEEDDDIKGPQLITGDNKGHLFIVDNETDKIKVLTHS